MSAGTSPATAQETGRDPAPPDVTLRVNAFEHRLSLDPRTTLIDGLREHLHLTGSKNRLSSRPATLTILSGRPTMVPRETAPSERLAARALEIESRGVHEHDVERREQIAPTREQILLHDVVPAARRKRRRGILLVFGELFAEPRHRAIEMMQFEALDAVDAESSRQRSAARSEPPHNRRCNTVRNAARSSAKSCLRALARRSITPRQPVSSHTRSKASDGPMRRVEIVVSSPRSSASSTIALSAKRAPERSSRSTARSPADPRSVRASRSPAGAPRRPRAGSRPNSMRYVRSKKSSGSEGMVLWSKIG